MALPFPYSSAISNRHEGAARLAAPWDWECWGIHLTGAAWQGLAAQAHPTPSQEQPGAPGQPQPQALRTSLGQGWAKPRQGCGLLGGPGSAGPMAGQDRAVGSWGPALLWHCWGRGWWPWGAETGSWAVGRVREPWGTTSEAQWQQVSGVKQLVLRT